MNFEKTNPGFNNFMKNLKASGFSPNMNEANAKTDGILGAKDSLNPTPSFSQMDSAPIPQKIKLRDGRVVEMGMPSPAQNVHREEVHHEIIPPQKEEMINPEHAIHLQHVEMKEEIPAEVVPKAEEPAPQTFETKFTDALKGNSLDDDSEKPLFDDEFKKLFSK